MRIFWRDVKLFVELPPALSQKYSYIEAQVAIVFSGTPYTFSRARPLTQAAWHPIIMDITANNTIDRLVWFFQNHDHPFVDRDPAVLHEGLRLVAADAYPYRSIYLSHWPEILRVSGKLGNQVLTAPHFVMFQIFSSQLLWFMFVASDWKGQSHKRTDDLMGETQIWGEGGAFCPDPDSPATFLAFFCFVGSTAHTQCTRHFRIVWGLMPINPQRFIHVYVPLREQNRHIAGYSHVKISNALYPPISDFSRPPQSYGASANSTVEQLLQRMLPFHESMWTASGGGNKFVFPQEVIKGSLDAYGQHVSGDIELPSSVWP